MKTKFFLILFCCFSYMAQAQQVINLKTKTKSNQAQRSLILDKVRAKMVKEFKQEFVFDVTKLNVSNNYAWFTGNAMRKDGKEIKLNTENNAYDCCHVEALLQKKNGKWLIVEYGAFSTDVWWDGICKRHKAPCVIFE